LTVSDTLFSPVTYMKATAQEQQSSEDPNDIVTIVSHKTFNEEDSGITAIIGEVRNGSPDTIGGVLIRGKFYDSNGQLIHLGDGSSNNPEKIKK
jgi:hypothetical protein